jgi:hypothetical protein
VFEVRVRSMRLDGDCPAALRDTVDVYDLAIDFTKSPEQITAALQCLFEEAIESERWTRRGRCAGWQKAYRWVRGWWTRRRGNAGPDSSST